MIHGHTVYFRVRHMAVTFLKQQESPPPAQKKKRGAGNPGGKGVLPHGFTWDAMKGIYIQRNLVQEETNPYSYKAMADEFGINLETVKHHASKEGWSKELYELRLQREKLTSGVIKGYDPIPEIQVRLRQAEFARLAMGKAIARIRELDPSTLSPKEATTLLKLGLEQERRALGIPDEFPQGPSQGAQDVNAGTTVQQAITAHHDVREIGAALLEFANKKLGRLPKGDVADVEVD